jgi:diketogulonate reductase-like aldo/keto reductase
VGTWRYGAAPESAQRDREVGAIQRAIELGQNHIDTAEDYANGGAEQVVGRAIAGSRREHLFIASKLWKNHVAAGTVRPAVEAMLQRLRTEYLDLLYIHHPWPDAPWRDAVSQINALIDEGVVRHIGVSNFNAAQLCEAEMLSHHPISAEQIRYSCGYRPAATPDLVEWCRAHHVTIVAYRPLDDGRLVSNAVLADIGSQCDATPAQVALAWLATKGTLPIPKALTMHHVEQNAAAAAIRLSQNDVARIDRSFQGPSATPDRTGRST